MFPLLISRPGNMMKTRVVVVSEEAQETLKKIQRLGILHAEEATELNASDIEAIEVRRLKTKKALGWIQDIISHLDTAREVSVAEHPSAVDIDEEIDKVEKLHTRIIRLGSRIDRKTSEINELVRLRSIMEPLSRATDLSLPEMAYSGGYLASRVCILSPASEKAFVRGSENTVLFKASTETDQGIVFVFVAPSADMERMDSLLKELGAAIIAIPPEKVSPSEFIARHEEIIIEHTSDIDEIKKELLAVIEENIEFIAEARENLTDEIKRLDVLEMAGSSDYVSLIEGWVPEENADYIRSALTQESYYLYVDTVEPGKDDKPPTRSDNPAAIRPFEVIVNLFATPKYADWDPTPSVAYFFAFFFGLMLNDMIYAVGLLFLAKFVLDKLVDDPASRGTSMFRRVLYISGSVALVFGILSGTYLGDFLNMFLDVDLESLALASAVQRRLSDPISFIVLSLVIGLVHVNIAHILGLVRGIKDKKKGVLSSKTGLFLIQIFGIPYIFQSMLGISLFPVAQETYAFFVYPLLLGLLLIVAGAFRQMGGLGSVFWIFDLTGILGDIMSYSRLAGVGLATFYLASSFNLLSEWVASGLTSALPGIVGIAVGVIAGTLLLLIFHIFNLFLSSLAAIIHSLRLCFVEFLLKFYEGGGTEYDPFRLGARRYVIVGTKT